mmetsp:Transcript_17068/g.31086  ORF Transcript_17068/g.31086 Transcript_17068/m.31086 type:complete len:299 (-) Transcript_17068:140-1036(-)
MDREKDKHKIKEGETDNEETNQIGERREKNEEDKITEDVKKKIQGDDEGNVDLYERERSYEENSPKNTSFVNDEIFRGKAIDTDDNGDISLRNKEGAIEIEGQESELVERVEEDIREGEDDENENKSFEEEDEKERKEMLSSANYAEKDEVLHDQKDENERVIDPLEKEVRNSQIDKGSIDEDEEYRSSTIDEKLEGGKLQNDEPGDVDAGDVWSSTILKGFDSKNNWDSEDVINDSYLKGENVEDNEILKKDENANEKESQEVEELGRKYDEGNKKFIDGDAYYDEDDEEEFLSELE